MGYRQDGEVFSADVWFSTYRTSAGARLAALVVDSSEELRDREEAGLHQLLASSRILVGAVSHEIRNVCGAIALVHQNLARCEHLDRNKDFEALGTLVLALENIAAMELRQTANQPALPLDLQSFLEELRIVIGPSMRDQGIDLRWDLPAEVPRVRADSQSLMQVFLNLTKNSERALSEVAHPWIRIAVRIETQRVAIEVMDNGGGIADPEQIFKPFQQHAHATGLGLYLSRALMRSFSGDLHYESGTEGACLTLVLARVDPGPIARPEVGSWARATLLDTGTER
jgi:signal transduction histidine kinase